MDPSPTRLRQIALVAEDLERARHLLTYVIGTEVVYEDPLVAQWGLKNILVPIGGDIIEVVSPLHSSSSIPVSRRLTKHGPGGYMLIMQTSSALSRLDYLRSHNLASPIFVHETPDSVCVQYHPNSMKGGVIPELDSQTVREGNEDPLGERFSAWHACGPSEREVVYREAMRRRGDLWMLGVQVRLGVGDGNVEGAAKQWERLFGVKNLGKGTLGFTNARMEFLAGEEGKKEGIEEMWIGVEGKKRLEGIFERARKEGLKFIGGAVAMLGIQWRFTLADKDIGKRRSML